MSVVYELKVSVDTQGPSQHTHTHTCSRDTWLRMTSRLCLAHIQTHSLIEKTQVMLIPTDSDSSQLKHTQQSSLCDDEIQSILHAEQDIGGSVSEYVLDPTCGPEQITHMVVFCSAAQICMS